MKTWIQFALWVTAYVLLVLFISNDIVEALQLIALTSFTIFGSMVLSSIVIMLVVGQPIRTLWRSDH